MRISCLTIAVLLALSLLAASSTNAQQAESSQTPPQEVDRAYTLESSILGYKGVGGTIDGIRNPLLQAAQGETVRITIINTEVLVHDIAMVKHGVKSTEVLDVGARTSITFTAQQSDTYYCTISGHRAAGMEGKFQISEEAGTVVAGLPVVQGGRPLNLGFEEGTFRDWTVTGDAFGEKPVEGDVVLARTGDTRSRHEGAFWGSSGEVAGHRATGTMTSVAFTVTQPYASFLVSGGALKDTRV
ncbi:MAG: cupredoxin domain-containing protein, partial [Rhodothermales bacterium]